MGVRTQMDRNGAGFIAFQGARGANSDMACQLVCPDLEVLPCSSFEETFAAVREGRAERAMIPIDNSRAGRVADNHHLLPESGLHIVGEHFQRIRHHLLAPRGATRATIQRVHSHIHALGQCRDFIRTHGFQPCVAHDTAGAAAEIAVKKSLADAAIAPPLAAELYNLDVLETDIQDEDDNTTRFVVVARDPLGLAPDLQKGVVVATFIFRVRSVPAALYKALGGFATNGVNITKLESYITDGSFAVAQFYIDIEGHPDHPMVRLALEELGFFSEEVRLLGVYPASPFRTAGGRK